LAAEEDEEAAADVIPFIGTQTVPKSDELPSGSIRSAMLPTTTHLDRAPSVISSCRRRGSRISGWPSRSATPRCATALDHRPVARVETHDPVGR
jgi:hypothetical protein